MSEAVSRPYAQIQVSDTGKGIKPEFLPYVFDRFRQAENASTRSSGGMGLGLAIVRHLVELHGGSVQADSPGEGQGATFTVQLPLIKGQLTPDQTGNERLRLVSKCTYQSPLNQLNWWRW